MNYGTYEGLKDPYFFTAFYPRPSSEEGRILQFFVRPLISFDDPSVVKGRMGAVFVLVEILVFHLLRHLSNASIGNHNPGINASLQFMLGYTWH